MRIQTTGYHCSDLDMSTDCLKGNIYLESEVDSKRRREQPQMKWMEMVDDKSWRELADDRKKR